MSRNFRLPYTIELQPLSFTPLKMRKVELSMGTLALHKNGQTPQDPQNWSRHHTPQGRQFEELDVTVDTGSTYTEVNHGKKPK